MTKRASQRPGKNGQKAELKIAVGIPLERNVPASAFTHFWEIARRGWPLMHRPYSRTDVNRNEYGKALLESDMTHLVMLDLDHRHPFDVVERLAAWPAMDRDRFQIVGGLAYRRGQPYNPCAYGLGADGHLHYIMDWEQGIAKVDAIGHAAIIIDRQVLERLPFPWWQYVYDGADQSDFQYPTEDLFFCNLAIEAGIEIWCDTTLVSPHLTESEIDDRMFRRYMQDHPPEFVYDSGVKVPYQVRELA